MVYAYFQMLCVTSFLLLLCTSPFSAFSLGSLSPYITIPFFVVFCTELVTSSYGICGLGLVICPVSSYILHLKLWYEPWWSSILRHECRKLNASGEHSSYICTGYSCWALVEKCIYFSGHGMYILHWFECEMDLTFIWCCAEDWYGRQIEDFVN